MNINWHEITLMCLFFYIIRLNKTGILDRNVKKLTEHNEWRNIKIF